MKILLLTLELSCPQLPPGPRETGGVEEGTVMLRGMRRERIQQAISVLDKQQRGRKRNLQVVKDYVAPNVSEKVVRIILSYCDYVNHNAWKKF